MDEARISWKSPRHPDVPVSALGIGFQAAGDGAFFFHLLGKVLACSFPGRKSAFIHIFRARVV